MQIQQSCAYNFPSFKNAMSYLSPVTGHGGSLGCETLRLPHFLDNWLTYGGEGASLIPRLTALYPQED
jgi:hypothetical protein